MHINQVLKLNIKFLSMVVVGTKSWSPASRAGQAQANN